MILKFKDVTIELDITEEEFLKLVSPAPHKFRAEDYPGQEYFHKNNPNIKRAEERFTQ